MDFIPGMIMETDSHDYILGGDSDLSKKIKLQSIPETNFSAEWNQKEINNSSCVIHGMLGALGKTLNKDFTNERALLLDMAKEQGIFEEGYGMKFSDGCNLVRRWRNTNNPNNKVLSFRVQYGDDFKLAILNGYRLAGGYKRSQDYINAGQDGVIEGDDYNGTGGHCISLEKGKKGYLVEEINSYKGVLKTNRYDIAKLDKLINQNPFWNEFYIFITEKMVEKIFEDIDSNNPFYEVVKKAKEKGIIKGYSDNTFRPNQPITRGEYLLILDRLGLLD